ncbi:MAG: hypothetical protein QXU74_01940 [Candidatus Aenigmatarchaeota archaeon]
MDSESYKGKSLEEVLQKKLPEPEEIEKSKEEFFKTVKKEWGEKKLEIEIESTINFYRSKMIEAIKECIPETDSQGRILGLFKLIVMGEVELPLSKTNIPHIGCKYFRNGFCLANFSNEKTPEVERKKEEYNKKFGNVAPPSDYSYTANSMFLECDYCGGNPPPSTNKEVNHSSGIGKMERIR